MSLLAVACWVWVTIRATDVPVMMTFPTKLAITPKLMNLWQILMSCC